MMSRAISVVLSTSTACAATVAVAPIQFAIGICIALNLVAMLVLAKWGRKDTAVSEKVDASDRRHNFLKRLANTFSEGACPITVLLHILILIAIEVAAALVVLSWIR